MQLIFFYNGNGKWHFSSCKGNFDRYRVTVTKRWKKIQPSALAVKKITGHLWSLPDYLFVWRRNSLSLCESRTHKKPSFILAKRHKSNRWKGRCEKLNLSLVNPDGLIRVARADFCWKIFWRLEGSVNVWPHRKEVGATVKIRVAL